MASLLMSQYVLLLFSQLRLVSSSFPRQQPFTESFPRAEIYELLSPDLLHQLIKGTFKDHLVQWVIAYLNKTYTAREAKRIKDIIDRWYVILYNPDPSLLHNSHSI